MPKLKIEAFTEWNTPHYHDVREYSELTRNSRLSLRQRAQSFSDKVVKSYGDNKQLKQKTVNAFIIATLYKIPVTVEEKFSVLPS